MNGWLVVGYLQLEVLREWRRAEWKMHKVSGGERDVFIKALRFGLCMHACWLFLSFCLEMRTKKERGCAPFFSFVVVECFGG